MLRVYELNCPASAVTLAVSTTSITNSVAHYIHLDGQIIGPTTGSETYSLAGISIAANKVGFLALYIRPVFDTTAGTTTWVSEVELTDTQDVKKVGSVYNQDYAGGFSKATTKSMPQLSLFTAGKTYVAGDLIRKDLEVYSAKVGFTAGATFNSDDWTLVTMPDATPRALLGYVLVINESASTFVGGTTSLAAAGITTRIFNETVYNLQ